MAVIRMSSDNPWDLAYKSIAPKRIKTMAYPSLALETSLKIAAFVFPTTPFVLIPATGYGMTGNTDNSSMMGQLVWNVSDVSDFFLSLSSKRLKHGHFLGPIAFADNFVFHRKGLFAVHHSLDWNKIVNWRTLCCVFFGLPCFVAELEPGVLSI